MLNVKSWVPYLLNTRFHLWRSNASLLCVSARLIYNVSCTSHKISGSVPSPEHTFPLWKSNTSLLRTPAHVEVHLLLYWVGLKLSRAWWVLTPWPKTLIKNKTFDKSSSNSDPYTDKHPFQGLVAEWSDWIVMEPYTAYGWLCYGLEVSVFSHSRGWMFPLSCSAV